MFPQLILLGVYSNISSDADIRVVTEYDTNKLGCVITKNGTNWELVKKYLSYIRGEYTKDDLPSNLTLASLKS